MKRLVTASVLVFCAALAGFAPALSAQAAQPDFEALLEANAIIEQKVMVPIRDGAGALVRTSTNSGPGGQPGACRDHRG